MPLNVATELRTLNAMGVRGLQDLYAREFGEPTRSNNKAFLIKRLAWRAQARAQGGLSERARLRAHQLADDADLRVRAPAGFAAEPKSAEPPRSAPGVRRDGLTPGQVLTRVYKGRTIRCLVREVDYECEGKLYGSLTAVAEAITGCHWNGRKFFGLPALVKGEKRS